MKCVMIAVTLPGLLLLPVVALARELHPDTASPSVLLTEVAEVMCPS